MAKKKKATKSWSYNTGDRGGRVRAFDKEGRLYLEWHEEVWDEAEGKIARKRKRALILDPETKRHVTSREEAIVRADRLATRFASDEQAVRQPRRHPTVAELIHMYLEEVTPTKGPSKQAHDRRAGRIFTGLFGALEARNLDRRAWDKFIHARHQGLIDGFGPVGDRQVEYDLKLMIAVLGWACGLIEHGRPVLLHNPWGPEIRRSHRMIMPRERSPNRPSMTDEIRAKLIAHAPNPQFRLALILGRYTISRNSSVRQLRWSDIDLEAGTIHWRKESDKARKGGIVPLLPEAIEALRQAPRGIGDAWVFPSRRDPSRPTPRGTFLTWMKRAKAAAGILIKGLGYHGEKRAGVRDPWFRALDPKMKETLSRTNHQTLIDIYDQVEIDEMRDAIQQRRPDRRWHQGGG
jgi:integrase